MKIVESVEAWIVPPTQSKDLDLQKSIEDWLHTDISKTYGHCIKRARDLVIDNGRYPIVVSALIATCKSESWSILIKLLQSTLR